MVAEKKRYFIELQQEGSPVPRSMEAAQKRAQAAHFIASIHDWLTENELNDKVSTMAITAMGQVLITCEADVIQLIHQQEETSIATIRHGSMFVEGISRWAQNDEIHKSTLGSVSR